MGAANSKTGPVRLVTAPSRLTVGASAVQGTSITCHGVLVKALCPGQTVYVGISSAVTTGTGYPLADGESVQFEVENVNKLWFIASAASQAVAFLPYVFT